MVDEFQDTNDVQYELVKLLSLKSQQLFVVGDPDQTIYTWRGANIDLILNLEKDYPNLKNVILNQNYRSSKTILAAANSLIKNNIDRIPKDLFTDNDDGVKIEYYASDSSAGESI
jgi:DNA helicase-2/ATP-dependent DNA helicase PcrA